jgi:cytochrome c oxidase subunit 2
MKKDAIPGFVNELWFKADEIGTYRGQCAELCGRDHGFMPVVVEVKSQADYDAWLQAQQAPVAPAAEAAAPAAAPAVEPAAAATT